MRRRMRPWDFHDYLTLRRSRDRGEAAPQAEARIAWLEEALPVRFAHVIPRLVEPLEVPERARFPRGLSAADVRFLFEVREEYARIGEARARLAGAFDLNTDAEGLKDWLDFVETERRAYKAAQQTLRQLDRKIWAAFTGDRRMPQAPAEALASEP